MTRVLTSPPGPIAVVSLLGKHDVTTAWNVRNAIARALERGTHLVVDLSETEFIDSSIVRALVDSERLASEQGLRISLQLDKRDGVKQLLGRPTPMTERSAAGTGNRPTVERRERWRCSWL